MLNSIIKYGNFQEELKHFLEANSFTKIFILVDENTKKNCLPLLPKLKHHLIEIKSGEQNKNLETCQLIWSELLKNNADRKALLINLGGGVISDMGGFAASCFKRGFSFINIPTTLLAMVDATVGGKTGVDFQFQKNMIGLFSLAEMVFIDPIFLNTLDIRQIKSGKAEMLKHGLIADENHFNAIIENEIPNIDCIQKSVSIKQEIVAADPYEKGIRKSLNFGHTLGHALESFYLQNNKDILHGEAVAQGMIWALQLSAQYNNLDKSIATKTIQLIEEEYGNIQLNNATLKDIVEIAKNDKKNTNQQINFCLLSAIGKCDINVHLSETQILATLTK